MNKIAGRMGRQPVAKGQPDLAQDLPFF